MDITTRDLQPLDFMLYRPKGVFGRAIQFHTGYNISHVEVYLGVGAFNGCSTASRDGKGVDFYSTRFSELAYVMRPTQKVFSVANAIAKAQTWKGTPYGWFDLADFFGFNVNARGIVCSPYATLIGRAAGIPLFNDVQLRKVAPFMFRTSELLKEVWSDGQDAAEDREAA